MLFVDNRGMTDPALNLALEEYLLRNVRSEEDFLLFYINEPSIIIGRNQNTAEEINAAFVKERGVHVVRRLSGGGAVYHDLGNLNFSFITNDDGRSFHNYRKFTEPVVQALGELGVKAELSGRNDIQVGERKISGNAQYISQGRMYSHGTLLFDSQVENIVSALNVNQEKIQSKGVKSIRSRVANISEFLREPLTMAEFKQRVLASVFAGHEAVPEFELSAADWAAVEKLADERYRSWDWNYGKSPTFNVQKTKRVEGVGSFDIRLQVEKGVIQDAVVYGDYFGARDTGEFTERLIGTRYDGQAVAELLDSVEISRYFGAIGREQLLELLV